MKWCLFFLFLFLYIDSFGQEKYSNIKTNTIVYRVFDSLEHYLCKATQLMKQKEDSVFIAIEPPNDAHANMYQIFVINFSQKPPHSHFELSNRKIEICGNLYPIYLVGIDQIFGDLRPDADLSTEFAYPSSTIYDSSPHVIVDFVHKKFWKR